jgi:uncharacterized protein (UPF0548 family)
MSDRRRALERLHAKRLNFDPERLHRLEPQDAWHVDDYCRPLPAGSFETAKLLMTDYEFADPAMVRATYDSDAPLAGRDMLLQIRFLGLRFHVGVRIGDEIVDEERTIDGRRAHVWGWSYRTLEGHFERGQMDYELRRFLDDDTVEFHIHAVSNLAPVRNPFVWLGLRLFGRREQVRFARRCGERMAEFTSDLLHRGPASSPHRSPP